MTLLDNLDNAFFETDVCLEITSSFFGAVRPMKANSLTRVRLHVADSFNRSFVGDK